MAISFQEYEDAIKTGGGIGIAKVEFLRLEDESVKPNETLIGEIIGGGLVIDRSNQVRRSTSMQLVNTDGQFNPSEDGRIWINSKFKVSLGLRMRNSDGDLEDKFFSQGVFVARSPKNNSEKDKTVLTLEGIDKFSLFDGQLSGKLQTTYIIATGTDILTAFRAVLDVKLDVDETIDRDPITPLLSPLPGTAQYPSITPYPIYEGIGQTLADVLDNMNRMTFRNMYYDELGRFHYEDDIPDVEKASIWDFTTEDSLYLGATHDINSEDVINKVIVVGTNISDNLNFVRGVATNNNVQSETSIQRIGVKMADPITVPTITTVEQAEGYAEYILRRRTVLQNEVSLRCVPLYHLNVDEIVTLTDSNLGFNKKRFVITSINLPFEPGEEMVLSLIDVDEFTTLS